MKQVQVGMVVGLIMLCCSLFGQAQQTGATSSNVVVPMLVSFSGVLTGSNAKPLTNITGVTFSLYAEQEGGSPLWLETQNVQPDKTGQYSVMLGSTTSQGLPASLFVSGQARWLEVQAQGQEPQPRVMLLSVPYALKAGDAQTLGGKPASAFATASGVNSSSQNSVVNNAITGGGTTDYVPLWLSKSKLGSSLLFQTGGKVGIGTATPAATLDVNGTVNAATSFNLETISKDVARTMNRIKSLYRSWAIACPGTTVYSPRHRAEWLGKIVEPGVRVRAQHLYEPLDSLEPVRLAARHELLRESQRHGAVKLLRQIPSIGPIRAALLVALLQTPHRFRTKRQLWAYSGFAVEVHDSGEYRYVRGKVQRNRERISVRGLNDNHNRDLKNLFKAAAISASTRPGPLQDFYLARVAKGIRPTMARLTLARKIAAIALTLWKKGASFDPQQLPWQAV